MQPIPHQHTIWIAHAVHFMTGRAVAVCPSLYLLCAFLFLNKSTNVILILKVKSNRPTNIFQKKKKSEKYARFVQ
jgi:hypothetical protein